MTVLLLPKFVLPVRPRGVVHENFAVVVEGTRIAELGPRTQLIRKFSQAEHVHLENHVLMPGLVNLHTHSPMTLLRGYADDLRLDTWLNDHIWPAEGRWANGKFVTDGTELAVAEMIRGGTSCFNEMYYFPDRIAKVAEKAGIRACVGLIVIDFESGWAGNQEEYLRKGMDTRARFSDCQELSFSIAPHSMYSVSDATLELIGKISSDYELPVHLHLLEIEQEIENSMIKHGVRPLQRVQRLGLLNQRLIAVHMAHLGDEDIALLAEHKVNVAHCPQSNLKLASGMCRVSDLQKSGVNVGIGTDSAASNNDLDLLDEARTAALLAKGVAKDPSVLNAETAVDMMTINGARALGLDKEIGTIETGKAADLCAIDLSHPRTQPVHHVISQVVYAASSSQVTDLWVAGRRILNSGEISTLDENRILAGAREWSDIMKPEEEVRENYQS